MKKFTAAMLTMALAGAMLTGCGSTASNTTADDSAAKDNTAAAATDGGTLRMGTNATFPPFRRPAAAGGEGERRTHGEGGCRRPAAGARGG